ncbi:MAG: hypothetical protein N838_29420 [Thiohalocapsa sp. PB-PSB1]|jgi:hypothetical protein|nr:MAG: hypothetical protein N838_29420 [Thiohalocapsa sp. PB-PSB1]
MAKDQLFCFLDVLGFSNLVKTRGLASLYSDYRELLEAANKQDHEGLVFSSWQGTPYFGMEQLQSTYFSDTIAFWSPYHPRDLQSLCYSIMEVLCKAIEIGLPLRGSISVGEAILDKEKQHFVGKPIVSAADAEKAQKWIGVTLSKEFREPPFNGGFSAACFMPWERHLKDGGLSAVTPLALDYPRWWRQSRKNSIQEAISRLNTDPAFSKYYKNALDFADYSAANSQWWESHLSYIESQKNA